MLKVSDIRKTRVYQEALEEGRKDEKAEVAVRLLGMDRPLDEIAAATGLNLAQIKRLKKKQKGA